MFTKTEAVAIIDAYNRLREWVLEIASDVPYSVSFDDDKPNIEIKGDEVVITWKRYESDYYGSGGREEERATIPVGTLSLNPEQLRALRAKVKQEEAERQKKVRAAEAAVARDRAEQRDRAEYARLTAKYEHGIVWPEGGDPKHRASPSDVEAARRRFVRSSE